MSAVRSKSTLNSLVVLPEKMLRGFVRSSSVLSRLRAPVESSAFVLQQQQIDAQGNAGSSLWHRLVGRRGMSDAAQDGISEKEAMDRVLMIVKAHPKVNPAKLNTSSHFVNDLGLDSLDVVEIVMGFEEEFNLHIPDEDADKLVSVPASVDFVAKHPMSR